MNVILAYHNRPAAHHVSHIGLGVSALNTAKILRENGIPTNLWAVLGTKEIQEKISAATANGQRPTHIVICAPWLPTLDLQILIFGNTDIQFAVTCHSNVGFLSADPSAITNFRSMLSLEQGALNFSAAGNSQRFCSWITASYGRPCTWLPNLYFMENESPMYRRPWTGGDLNIGAFGAVRPLKNTLSAVAAALILHADLNVQINFHINVGRIEGGGTVVRSIEEMTANVPNFNLIKDPWYQWPQFRQLIKRMNILIQPSYTESFNMVTADGAAECIPSVVSDAIDWAPAEWQAEVDDAVNIAYVAKNLLNDMHSGAKGFRALRSHNDNGLISWKNWVSGK